MSAIGICARPLVNGSIPSTPCEYCGRKKNMLDSAAGEAKARHYQMQVRGALQQAEEGGIAARRGLVAALTGNTAYQDHAAAS